jgi:hypothetical protein
MAYKTKKAKVGGTYPQEWYEFVKRKEKEVKDWQKKHKR